VAYFDDRTFSWYKECSLKPFQNNFIEMEKKSTSKPFLNNVVDMVVNKLTKIIEFGLSFSRPI
jgi:hypothetical protein